MSSVRTKGSGTSSTTDYEQLTYNANSYVISRRLRNGNSIGFTYDALNRATHKDLPGTELDVDYAYDNLNRLTSATQKDSGGATVQANGFTYDALSRVRSESGPEGTTNFGYDAASRKTQIVYPGTSSLTIDYTYLLTDELSQIKQGSTALATYGYDDLGNRTGVTFANAASQAFGYDTMSRLTSLTNELSGTASDLTKGYTYNPASQIISETKSNTAYSFIASNVNEPGTANGKNELTQYAGQAVTNSGLGNLSGFGSDTFTYTNESQLRTANVGGVGTTLTSDPLMRLYQSVGGGVSSKYAYDGINALAEYNGPDVLQRRWVYDPTTGQPVIWYEGTGITATERRYLSADERGSIISVSDSTGASLGINTFDEYGNPGGALTGRYGYTGQAWLANAKLWHLTMRAYSPGIGGRFLQPDPLGYGGDGPNLYAYVLNDPVNAVDPTGLDCVAKGKKGCPVVGDGDVTVIGERKPAEFCELFGIDCGPGPGLGGPGSEPTIAGLGVAVPNAPAPSKRCPSHPILGALGKLSSGANTLIGALAGTGSAIVGALEGYDPEVHFVNNALQFTNAATINGRAYTIGNVQVFSPGNGPGVFTPSYSGAIVSNGLHEQGHTIQSEMLGPFYLPMEAIGTFYGDMNPLEVGADKYALGLSCNGF